MALPDMKVATAGFCWRAAKAQGHMALAAYNLLRIIRLTATPQFA